MLLFVHLWPNVERVRSKHKKEQTPNPGDGALGNATRKEAPADDSEARAQGVANDAAERHAEPVLQGNRGVETRD